MPVRNGFSRGSGAFAPGRQLHRLLPADEGRQHVVREHLKPLARRDIENGLLHGLDRLEIADFFEENSGKSTQMLAKKKLMLNYMSMPTALYANSSV